MQRFYLGAKALPGHTRAPTWAHKGPYLGIQRLPRKSIVERVEYGAAVGGTAGHDGDLFYAARECGRGARRQGRRAVAKVREVP